MEAFITTTSHLFSSKISKGLIQTTKVIKDNIYKRASNSSKSTSITMTKSLNFWIKSSLGLSIFICPSISQAISDTKPDTNVYDDSGVLTKSSINFLEKTLQKLKETNGTNVYFISVRNLPYGIEPEQYAEELFQKWNLGEKDILVVLANKIARAGIFSGSGVPNLTKEKAKSISEETYPFKAKEEQYSSAALDVSNRLVSILSNKGDPGPPALVREGNSSNFKSAKATEQQRSKYVAIIIILLVVAFVVPMVQFFYYVKDE